MAKQKPIDLSVFDEAIKSSPSKKIDLSVFDEAVKPASVEKKNPFQTVLPTGTKPSKLGFEPFEKKVATEAPSVLTESGKVGYQQNLQQALRQKEILSGQLKSAQKAYTSAQGEGLAEEIASIPTVEQGQIAQAEPSYENIAPLLSGVQNVTSSFYKIPRYIYDVFAIPQNLAAEALNVPELKADYDQVSKGTYNPLGVLDRVGDYSSGKAKEWESKQRKYDDDIVNQLSKGDFANAGLQIFDNIVASAPSIAAMYLTGGAANAAKLGGLSKTLATALPFASAQNQELANNENIPDWLKPVNSAFNAISEVIFEERFGTKAILDGLTKVAETQGKDIAVKSAKDFIYNYIKKALSKVQPVTDVLANSIEEGATRASQNIIAKITGEDSNRKIMDGVADATIVGGAQGLGASTLRKGFDLITDKKTKAKVDDLNKKREDLSNDLSNENLPDTVKEQIENKIESINEQINNELDVNRDKINNLPEETKVEVSQLSDKIESINESLQDETISETTKSLLEDDLKIAQAELDAKFKIAKPTFDTEEQITKEGQKAEAEFKETKDLVTYEQKMKELNDRANNLVPAPEDAEIVEPIRQLGTGANVYFETEKYRVNDELKNGKVLLNIQSKTSEAPIANIEFDNANDAVIIAQELNDKFPDGVPDAILIDKYIEQLKKDLLKPQEDAIQVETAGQVPVLTEATVSEEVEQGKPEAKPKVVAKEGVKAEEVGAANEKLRVLGERKVQKGKGSWRKAFNDTTDPFRKASILRAIAEISTDVNEQNDILEAAKEMPEESNIVEEIKRKQSPTQEQTPAQEVEQLRAEEQSELNAAIPNPDQYLTDGKVDRAKITDAKDLEAFDEIYDKYDKLITPLLPKKTAPAKAEPKLKSKVATRLLFKKAVDLFYDISDTEGSAKKRTISAKRRTFMEQNPSIKYIDDNWSNISKQLKEKGLLEKSKGCP